MGMIFELLALKPDEIEQLTDDPSTASELFQNPGDQRAVLSLEKSWHGLHFLLTGTAWEGEPPLNWLLGGGEPMGDDLGYGPTRLFGPDAVRSIDDALSALDENEFWSRFDPDRMSDEQIYPMIWDEPEKDLRDEYLFYFHELKKLVAETRAAGGSLLVALF